jgi:hypothetical protein
VDCHRYPSRVLDVRLADVLSHLALVGCGCELVGSFDDVHVYLRDQSVQDTRL